MSTRPEAPLPRRRFLHVGTVGLLTGLVSPWVYGGRASPFDRAGPAAGRGRVSTRAVDLVLGSPVIDMLGLLTLDWPKLWRWQRQPDNFAESDFDELRRSGVDIFHPAVKTGGRDPYVAVREWIRGWNRLLDSAPCFLQRIETTDDLRGAGRAGRVGVIVGFQDSDHFRSVEDVAHFCDAGQRVSQLTYNRRNRLGSGCYERDDRGLTGFGAEVISAMNRTGMAVDLSHCGERTTLDAIEASAVPVLVTHSNCRSLVPAQPRCKSDEVIRRLAGRGGVFGVTAVRAFVGAHAPTLADLLDHFDHVARIAGVEHVGLGSDVDVSATVPGKGRIDPIYDIRGLVPEARVFQIADGLLQRGWLAADVEGVLGGNFLRALDEIWPAPSGEGAPWRNRRDPFCPVPGELGAGKKKPQ